MAQRFGLTPSPGVNGGIPEVPCVAFLRAAGFVWVCNLDQRTTPCRAPVIRVSAPRTDGVPRFRKIGRWAWLKNKESGLRRFWSLFPFTKGPFLGIPFSSHSQVVLFIQELQEEIKADMAKARRAMSPGAVAMSCCANCN